MKIKWFSRHTMTPEQLTDLKRIYGSDITICQQNETVEDVRVLLDDDIDIYAVVLPAEKIADLKNLTDKPIITARSRRVRILTEEPTAEAQFQFVHDGWVEYDICKIVTHKL